MGRRVLSRSEATCELSTVARKDAVVRDLLLALQRFVEVTLVEHNESSEWVSQDNSPLGRRGHIRAVRRGDLPGNKVGRKFLVRRTDIERYLAAHRVIDAANDSADAYAGALTALDLAQAG
jgi:hypothetical protein